MKPATAPTYHREWCVVPGKGTNTEIGCEDYWEKVASCTCPHCGDKIGRNVGVFVYHPEITAAHVVCVEQTEERTRQLRTNAFIVDACACAAKLSPSQFRDLPCWEKDRLIAEHLASRSAAQQSEEAQEHRL
jgi:hypothetical protein